MNYQKIYDSLCLTRQLMRPKKQKRNSGLQTHHIVPRCMGGDDSKANLVHLTPREHFIAHRLLTKIYPNSHELHSAYWLMSKNKKIRITSRTHETLCQNHSRLHSEKMSGAGNPFYNQHHTEQTKAIMSERKQKWVYITPLGEFLDRSLAAKAFSVHPKTIYNRCKNSEQVISGKNNQTPIDWVGKTWGELGWGIRKK